jgi:hypothetical protein
MGYQYLNVQNPLNSVMGLGRLAHQFRKLRLVGFMSSHISPFGFIAMD